MKYFQKKKKNIKKQGLFKKNIKTVAMPTDLKSAE